MCVDSNRAAEEMFGVNAAALRGTTIDRMIPAESTANLAEDMARLRAEGTIDADYTLQHRNGRAIGVHVRAAALKDRGLDRLLRDVTQERREMVAFSVQDTGTGMDEATLGARGSPRADAAGTPGALHVRLHGGFLRGRDARGQRAHREAGESRSPAPEDPRDAGTRRQRQRPRSSFTNRPENRMIHCRKRPTVTRSASPASGFARKAAAAASAPVTRTSIALTML